MFKSVLLSLTLFPALSIAATIQIGDLIDVTDLGTDFIPLSGNTQGDYVGYRKSTNQAAVRRANGTVEDIGTLGGSTSRATHISADGNKIYGWGPDTGGTDRTFLLENGTVTALPNLPDVANRPAGVDNDGNVIVNLIAPVDLVFRWNTTDSSSTLLAGGQATGINNSGVISGVTSSDGFYFDGTQNFIPPAGYFPSAGISDNNLTGGQLNGSLAAFFRIGNDPNAQFIPNIWVLGPNSIVTGLTNDENLFGNTDSTVFAYSLTDRTLYDLNADFNTSGAAVDTITDILGAVVGSADTFFGTYDDFSGVERSFVASFVLDDRLQGDFDDDFDVDGADFLEWQRAFPILGGLDLLDWIEHYGEAATPVTAVPEPSTLLLFALASLSWRRPRPTV